VNSRSSTGLPSGANHRRPSGACWIIARRRLRPRISALWRNRTQLRENRAKFKIAFIVKNMAIKKVFLISIEYYTCGIQNIDDIILMARFDDSGASCSHFCQRLG
jgi:hypothetical protein